MNIQWKTYIILLLTLALGGVLGMLSTHLCHKSGYGGIYKCRKGDGGYHGYGKHGKGYGHHGKSYGHHGMKNIEPEHILKKMKRHLDLTPEQITKIEPMLKGYSEKINKNLTGHRKAMMDIMAEMETALAPILDEKQMQRFKKKLDKKRKYLRPKSE